jgi:ElaB/YqjD/DUF883 family membrane-anchored ribosome-binding protein
MPKKADRTAGVTDATQDVQHDLRALREDLSTLAQEVTNLMGSTGNQTLDDVKDRIRGIRSALDEVISEAGVRGRDTLRGVSENLIPTIEESIKERPLMTLALALGLGFFLGATWRK